jgi:hypothetical protein
VHGLRYAAFRSDLHPGLLVPQSTVAYGFSSFNAFAGGTDPCDINDAVWRTGTIFMQDTTRSFLPIRRVWSGDVDDAAEELYFPLLTGPDRGDSWVL